MQGYFCFPSDPELPMSNVIVSHLLCNNIMWYPEETAVTTIFPPLGHLIQTPAGAQCQVTLGLGHTTTEYDRHPQHPHLHCHCRDIWPRHTAFSKKEKARPQGTIHGKDCGNGDSLPELVTPDLSLKGGESRSLRVCAYGIS